jgi:thiol-disulfide isomerase/thioredoxin
MAACVRNKIQGYSIKTSFDPARDRYLPQANPAPLGEESMFMRWLNEHNTLYSVVIITAISGALIASAPAATPMRQATTGTRAGKAGREAVGNFRLQSIAGGFMTNADLKGKVTVVDLFATWCGPCISEIPRYNQLYSAYQGRPEVAIVGIAVESPRRGLESKIQQLGIKYPVLIGNNDALSAFGDVEAFPTTVVIDKEGKIYKTYRGATPNKQNNIKQDIEHLLAEASQQERRPIS